MEISTTTEAQLRAQLADLKAEAARTGDWKAYAELKSELKLVGIYR